MNTNIPRLPSWHITPEQVYLNRRRFMGGALLAAGAAALAACAPSAERSPDDAESGSGFMETTVPQGGSDESGNPATSYASVVQYNNFYEFSTDKAAVAGLAQNFRTSPWTVEVGGLAHKPRLFDIEDIRRMFDSEERIYRMRCVEGWSMVIPWLGFPLSLLLDEVEPMGSARYVRFETLLDEEQMPGTRSAFYPWAYQEGLRIDEAAHPLTMLATGLYGSDLLPQSGAPLRLVVPWKYGFKSIKSIVKIELVEEMPATFWNTIAPHEYGFYANVNPAVHHPRWSQASERRIGESGRTPTLMFNGYAGQVASLYTGMDLAQQF